MARDDESAAADGRPATGDGRAAGDASPAADPGPPLDPHEVPDTVDRAAAPYPFLAFLSHNRYQVVAVFAVGWTFYVLATEGFDLGALFFVIMSLLFSAAAVFEYQGRRRIRARRSAEAEAEAGTGAAAPGEDAATEDEPPQR